MIWCTSCLHQMRIGGSMQPETHWTAQWHRRKKLRESETEEEGQSRKKKERRAPATHSSNTAFGHGTRPFRPWINFERSQIILLPVDIVLPVGIRLTSQWLMKMVHSYAQLRLCLFNFLRNSFISYSFSFKTDDRLMSGLSLTRFRLVCDAAASTIIFSPQHATVSELAHISIFEFESKN